MKRGREGEGEERGKMDGKKKGGRGGYGEC